MGWRWRWRWKKRGRPPSWLYLNFFPRIKRFIPFPSSGKEPITLSPAELEAMRLVDLKKLTQEEAAKKMKTSRGTVWRLLESAREKLIKAIVEGREILIEEGERKKWVSNDET